MNNPIISADIKKRAKFYLGQIDNNIGSLAPASGYGFIRKNVARFINNQSGLKLKKDDVILTEGSCNAINLIFNSIISGPNDGIMVPSPNFPLITSLVSLNNGKLIYYSLDEENEWQFDLESMEQQYNQSVKEKINVKAMFLRQSHKQSNSFRQIAEPYQILLWEADSGPMWRGVSRERL